MILFPLCWRLVLWSASQTKNTDLELHINLTMQIAFDLSRSIALLNALESFGTNTETLATWNTKVDLLRLKHWCELLSVTRWRTSRVYRIFCFFVFASSSGFADSCAYINIIYLSDLLLSYVPIITYYITLCLSISLYCLIEFDKQIF